MTNTLFQAAFHTKGALDKLGPITQKNIKDEALLKYSRMKKTQETTYHTS